MALERYAFLASPLHGVTLSVKDTPEGRRGLLRGSGVPSVFSPHYFLISFLSHFVFSTWFLLLMAVLILFLCFV